MPDEIANFLDNFKLGTSIQILIICGGFFFTIYKWLKSKVKDIEQKGSEKTLGEIEETERDKKLDDYKTTIEKLQKEITDISDEFNRFKESIHGDVLETDEKIDLSSTNVDNLHKETLVKIEEICKEFHVFEKRIETIEKQIKSTDEMISILMNSDIGSHKAWIIHEYNRCVKEDREIDLISLQNIENIYRLYLDEVGDGGDEFVTKLMHEIRNLPTKVE